MLALFAGLASAQVGGQPGVGTAAGTAFTCSVTNGAVTPTLRAEGYTELTGDIVLICSGGTALASGTATPIPTANITVFLNTTVTSRLLPTTAAPNASEALLLIDEPGAALTGYGPSVPQTPCNTPQVGAGPGGCVEYIGQSTVEGSGATVGGVPVSAVPSGTTCTSVAGHSNRVEGDFYILNHSKPGEQGETLEDYRYPFGRPGHRLIAEKDTARGRSYESADRAQQGRFAGT